MAVKIASKRNQKKYKKACNILDRIILKSKDATDDDYASRYNQGKYACLPTFKQISYLLTKFNIEHNLEKYKESHYESVYGGEDDTKYTYTGYRLEIPPFKERVVSDDYDSIIEGTKQIKGLVELSLSLNNIDKIKFASKLLNIINTQTGMLFGKSPRKVLTDIIAETVEDNMWDYTLEELYAN
tara:strand:- start:5075 stop:5626 length:552 start_codon:yes stop_codon:yes gene_type:complete